MRYVHLDTLLQHVHNSPFFSIVIDESTDVAVNKQLIMYVRYIEPAGPVTSFATILQLEEGSALAIYVAICNQLKVWNVDLGKLVGFASDGAAVMTGVRNGVVARLCADIPHIVGVHCVAHRLALATIKATDSSPEIRIMRK